MKRLAGYTAIVLATLTVLYLLWLFRAVVALFLLSLVTAAVFRPVTRRLVARGLPTGAAVLLTYAAVLATFGLLLTVIGDELVSEINTLVTRVATVYESRYELWLEDGTSTQQAIVARLPTAEAFYAALTGENSELLAQTVLGVTQSFVTIIGGLLLMLVLSVYWTVDRDHFERLWLSLLAPENRMQARDIWRAIESGTGSYVRSEAIQSFLAAVFLGVGYTLLGLNYPLLLALAGALAWFVPLLGALLITPAVLLVAWTTPELSPFYIVAAGAYTIGVLLLLELVLEPRLFNRRQYSSLLLVALMIPLADTFGILGLIIAPPLSAAIQILVRELVAYRPRRPAEEPANQIDDLKSRLSAVRLKMEESGEAPPEIKSMVQRLTRLIHEAEALQHMMRET